MQSKENIRLAYLLIFIHLYSFVIPLFYRLCTRFEYWKALVKSDDLVSALFFEQTSQLYRIFIIIFANILYKTMTTDERYMARCLELAQYGRFTVAPNPMVGAVIVHNGKIIGEGYHRRYGEPHAEVNAICSVKEQQLLRESTIYVSLEPCAHYGKTPPCADLIIEKGIPRVVIGCRDSFDQVDGKGIQKLRAASVEVVVGVLEEECKSLNRTFFTFHSKKRPYIVLKWAQSSDGYIDSLRDATLHAVRFSTDKTSMRVHRLRALSDAILVGRRTAELDNPSLTTRMWPGRNPLRLVIDRKGMLSKRLNLFDRETKTIVFTEFFRDFGETDMIEQVNLDFNAGILPQITRFLYEHKVQRLLVEGGRKTLESFIEADLWDEAYIEETPIVLSSGVKAPHMKNIYKKESTNCFGNTINYFSHEK